MKATELIALLQGAVEEYGDRQVWDGRGPVAALWIPDDYPAFVLESPSLWSGLVALPPQSPGWKIKAQHAAAANGRSRQPQKGGGD